MTGKQLKLLAKEIAMMKHFVPDWYRLQFATVIRDVVQMTKTFPNWEQFVQDCGLTGNEKKPINPARQLCFNKDNWDLPTFLKIMGWEQDSYSENMFLKFQEAGNLLGNFDSLSLDKLTQEYKP